MNSENSALASSSMKISRKLPSQMPNPGSPYSFSHMRQPLLPGHLEERPAVGLVDEAARRAGADGEDLVVART